MPKHETQHGSAIARNLNSTHISVPVVAANKVGSSRESASSRGSFNHVLPQPQQMGLMCPANSAAWSPWPPPVHALHSMSAIERDPRESGGYHIPPPQWLPNPVSAETLQRRMALDELMRTYHGSQSLLNQQMLLQAQYEASLQRSSFVVEPTRGQHSPREEQNTASKQTETGLL